MLRSIVFTTPVHNLEQVDLRNVFPAMSSTVSLAFGVRCTAFDNDWTFAITFS